MLDLGIHFDHLLNDFAAPKAPPMGPQIAQKSDFGHHGPPRDAGGRPEASREPFGGFWGSMLDSFRAKHHSKFGPNIGMIFLCDFGSILGSKMYAKTSIQHLLFFRTKCGSHFGKNICFSKMSQQISGLILSREYILREEVRPIFQIADLAI